MISMVLLFVRKPELDPCSAVIVACGMLTLPNFCSPPYMNFTLCLTAGNFPVNYTQ